MMDADAVEKYAETLDLQFAITEEMAEFVEVMDHWDATDLTKLRRYLELHKEFREKVETELCSTVDRS